MNQMKHFTTHFQAPAAAIIVDEETGWPSSTGDGTIYWQLFVKGVAHMVWTDGITGEIVFSHQRVPEVA